MTTYIVERMSEADYQEYLEGGHNYYVENLHIEAETPEEAANKAVALGYVVNYNYVITLKKYEAKKIERKEAINEREKKAAEAKAKKLATEARKAEKAGMSVEEYRKEKARKVRVKKLEKELEEFEKELKRKKVELKKLTK